MTETTKQRTARLMGMSAAELIMHCQDLTAELDSLKADKERLDWLEKYGGDIGIDHVSHGDYRYYAGGKHLREVVDGLMKGN